MKLVDYLNYYFTGILQDISHYKGKLDSELWSSKKFVLRDGTNNYVLDKIFGYFSCKFEPTSFSF